MILGVKGALSPPSWAFSLFKLSSLVLFLCLFGAFSLSTAWRSLLRNKVLEHLYIREYSLRVRCDDLTRVHPLYWTKGRDKQIDCFMVMFLFCSLVPPSWRRSTKIVQVFTSLTYAVMLIGHLRATSSFSLFTVSHNTQTYMIWVVQNVLKK